MSRYIKNLIKEGEHQQQDFKFEIADSRKIARSLVAFSNTNGGKLLVGVKDNGAIAGVRSDEEFHMVEAAAQLYCKPEIVFTAKEWTVDGKSILEINIPKMSNIPHFAKNEDNKWLAYIRVKDKNLLANKILLEVWKRKKKTKGVYIKYSKIEKLLLDSLKNEKQITLNQFCKLAKIPRFKAEKVLVNFVLLKIIDIIFTEKGTFYKLNKDYRPNKEIVITESN